MLQPRTGMVEHETGISRVDKVFIHGSYYNHNDVLVNYDISIVRLKDSPKVLSGSICQWEMWPSLCVIWQWEVLE